jgi:hypothetical protein
MRIFISVASPDRPKAEEVALALRGDGHVVFLDDHDLPVAQTYHERIRQAIAQADVVLFFISPLSVQPGRYTLSELKFAQEKWPHPKGRLLPVMIEPTPMSSIPAYAKAITIMSPRGNLAAEVVFEVGRLEKRIERHSGRSFARAWPSTGATWGADRGGLSTSPTLVFAVLLFLGLGTLAGLVNSFLVPALKDHVMMGGFSRGLTFASIVAFALLYFDLGQIKTLLIGIASTVAAFMLADRLPEGSELVGVLLKGAVCSGVLVLGLSLALPELRDKFRWGIVTAAGALGPGAGELLDSLGVEETVRSASWEALVAGALCYVVGQVAEQRSSTSWHSGGAQRNLAQPTRR